MKLTNIRALSKRYLVALTLSAVSIAGLAGLAEAATCSSCHAPAGSTTDMRPVEGAFRNITTGSIVGSHAKHIPAPTLLTSACTPCHGTIVTTYTTKHTITTGGLINMANIGYTKGTSFAQSGSPVLGSCGSASCHADPYASAYKQSPTWGVTTANCTSCHNGVYAFTGAGSSPNTGSHTKHMAYTGYAINCGNCHAGATALVTGGTSHLDGNIDVTNSYTANVAKHTSGTGYSSCSTASCHVSPTSTQTVTTNVWGTAGCATCHNAANTFSGTGNSPATGSHTKHMAAANVTCGSCHTGAIAMSTGGASHLDGNIDVANGYPVNVTKHLSTAPYAGSCNNAVCHSPYGTAGSTPTWGVSGAGCVTCHNGQGSFTGTGNGPATGSHTKHMAAANVSCGSCHTGAVALSTGGSNHLTGYVTVANGYPVNVTKHAIGSAYAGSCNNASCHSPYGAAGSTPTWGVTGGGCATCHNTGTGSFTGTGNGPATGSHTKHMAAANVTCGSCHTGAVALSTGGAAHADGNIDVANGYPVNVTKHTIGSAYAGSCNNASCHSPYGAAGSTPTWGVTGGGCATCHNGTGSFTGTGSGPNTGSHTKHMAAAGVTCGSCHTGAVALSTGGASHFDGHIDVANGYPVNVTKHTIGSAYAGSCNNASCHSPYGTAGSTPTWGVTGGGCTTCHNGAGSFTGTGNSPATGSHTKHMANSATCGSCHTGAAALSTGGANHLNGFITVANGYPANVAKHAIGTSYTGRCTNASCHADPYSSAFTTTPTWGAVTAGANCGSCHTGAGSFTGLNNSPTTGTHTAHINAGKVCNDCHAGAVAGVSGGPASTHGDGNIDVISGTYTLGYTVNVTKHAAGTYVNVASCANACHGAAVWGTTLDCLACHTSAALTAPNANTLSAGAVTTRRGISTEFTQSSNHTRSRGAITANDCGVCHMEGIAATGKKNSAISPTTSTAYHGNGLVELRDPDTGTTIVAQQFSGTPGAFADKAGTPPAVFVRFQRNLAATPESETGNYVGTTNTIFEVNSAIQVKHCLNCHDSNGASNALAQVPSATTSTKPFAATVAANPGGNVLDVKAQFQTSNRSYHPVLAKQNNAFAGGTRMAAPWNGVAKSGTTAVYGPLITCWDCHAPNSSTGTLTATTTHGSAVNSTDAVALRGNVYLNSATATTSALNLCLVCHVTSGTNTTHGPGSALTTSPNGSMTYFNNRCYYCHSGADTTAKPARPIGATDAHGYNTNSTGGAFAAGVGYGFLRRATGPVTVKSVGGTAYTPACGTFTGICSRSMGGYTPGGVY